MSARLLAGKSRTSASLCAAACLGPSDDARDLDLAHLGRLPRERWLVHDERRALGGA